MSQSTLELENIVKNGLVHHKAGRLAEAEALYRQVLTRQPDHAEALHLLGIIAYQGGQLGPAAELVGRAIALQPNHAEAYNTLGSILRAQRKVGESVAAFFKAVQLHPQFAEAHFNLAQALKENGKPAEAAAAYTRAVQLKPELAKATSAAPPGASQESGVNKASPPVGFADKEYERGNAFMAQGRSDEAVAAFARAVQLAPSFVEAHNNLGAALNASGRLDEALAAYSHAIRLAPSMAEAHYNLGNVLAVLERLDESRSALSRAIQLKPTFAEAYNHLGGVLTEQGKFGEAAIACSRALELRPNFAEAYNNLGNVFEAQGKYAEAISAYHRSLSLSPDLAQAHTNLGSALKEQGRFTEAVAAYDRAIRLEPDDAETHWKLSLSLLRLGDFDRGLREYEWRWKRKEAGSLQSFPQPRWDGRELNGRTILLHAEQGFGDTIQFARYAPMVAARGGRVLLQCQPELLRVVRGLGCVAEVITRGELLPWFDVHCPMLSLPLTMGTRLESIPVTLPYISVDPLLCDAWALRLGNAVGVTKVGLAWAGSPTNTNDRSRSIFLAQFAPMAAARNIMFFSLQKGDAARQAAFPPPGMPIIDHTDELRDFADTAALISHLDLVITVDTAVAHLAATMGKPVWILLPFIADWRWLLAREDSPWYPTMRLFRQNAIGDWPEVISRVANCLSGFEAAPLAARRDQSW